jgi:hypothetical protein
MKSLVLFIKPKHDSLSNSIENVFQKCSFRYPVTVIEAEDPSVVAEKKLKELMKEVSQIAEAEKVQAEMEKVQTCTSNLPKDMNNSVQEGEIPAQLGINMIALKFAEEELVDLLLIFLKIGVIFLSVYVIFDQSQNE